MSGGAGGRWEQSHLLPDCVAVSYDTGSVAIRDFPVAVLKPFLVFGQQLPYNAGQFEERFPRALWKVPTSWRW